MAKLGIWAVILVIVSTTLSFSPARSEADALERGRYLVEEVAQCGWCHSPRDERGELDATKWLEGAPVWFQPSQRVPNWAYSAPPLAGLPSFTPEQVIKVLTTGRARDGRPLRRPMRPYRMKRADAEAIVAYLKSLPAPIR
jgi:mono/diheme cytochrome c family protein